MWRCPEIRTASYHKFDHVDSERLRHVERIHESVPLADGPHHQTGRFVAIRDTDTNPVSLLVGSDKHPLLAVVVILCYQLSIHSGWTSVKINQNVLTVAIFIHSTNGNPINKVEIVVKSEVMGVYRHASVGEDVEPSVGPPVNLVTQGGGVNIVDSYQTLFWQRYSEKWISN